MLHPCNDEQRRQYPPGLCHRARSGVTDKVSVFVLKEFRMHKGFQRVQSGQLRFLGSDLSRLFPGLSGRTGVLALFGQFSQGAPGTAAQFGVL
jgi:hypothetical protein